MDLDDHVCLCFRVSKRKLLQHIRVNQPRVASQMSECGGAGTGCGWCVPFLRKLYEQNGESLPSADEYAAARNRYRETGERLPPETVSTEPEDVTSTESTNESGKRSDIGQ